MPRRVLVRAPHGREAAGKLQAMRLRTATLARLWAREPPRFRLHGVLHAERPASWCPGTMPTRSASSGRILAGHGWLRNDSFAGDSPNERGGSRPTRLRCDDLPLGGRTCLPSTARPLDHRCGWGSTSGRTSALPVSDARGGVMRSDLVGISRYSHGAPPRWCRAARRTSSRRSATPARPRAPASMMRGSASTSRSPSRARIAGPSASRNPSLSASSRPRASTPTTRSRTVTARCFVTKLYATACERNALRALRHSSPDRGSESRSRLSRRYRPRPLRSRRRRHRLSTVAASPPSGEAESPPPGPQKIVA
jgi:hypothetical protein